MSTVLKSTIIANAAAISASVNYSFVADTNVLVAVQAIYTITTGNYTITLQGSLDNVNFVNFAAGTVITASGTTMLDIQAVWKDYNFWRVAVTKTSGTIDSFTLIIANIVRT